MEENRKRLLKTAFNSKKKSTVLSVPCMLYHIIETTDRKEGVI